MSRARLAREPWTGVPRETPRIGNRCVPVFRPSRLSPSVAPEPAMTTALADPFARLKASEREHWASFAPAAIFSTVPAAKLVKFAKVSGLDLSPDLLHRARDNAVTASVEIDFLEGDAEALPYPDATFNIVLSQFGHIFAPR